MKRGGAVMTESDDGAKDIEDELQEVRGALRDDTIATLGPAEPICMAPTATVEEAIARMLERRQACVLVVDGDGRLTGILTERDVLMRVAGAGRDPRQIGRAHVELQSQSNLVCRLLLEKKKKKAISQQIRKHHM